MPLEKIRAAYKWPIEFKYRIFCPDKAADGDRVRGILSKYLRDVGDGESKHCYEGTAVLRSYLDADNLRHVILGEANGDAGSAEFRTVGYAKDGSWARGCGPGRLAPW